MLLSKKTRASIGIFDHIDSAIGGGQLVIAKMAEILSQEYSVEIIHSGRAYRLEKLTEAFGVDLHGVRERIVGGCESGFSTIGERRIVKALRKCKELTSSYDVFVYSGHGVPPFCYGKRGIVYCHFPMEPAPAEVLKGDRRWLNRHPIDRYARLSAHEFLWRIQIGGYSDVLTNSYFTKHWIQNRWRRDAEVVYPPVELEVPKVDKSNTIAAVGRFTGANSRKNQLAVIQALGEFLAGIEKSWKLCLIGSCSGSHEDQAFLESVKRAVNGLPVTFLVNVERRVVCETLAQAKLFWHTAGLHADEGLHPQEAEHFGIATVEAMRAGCVPVVIASGGQREIIEDGRSGFLCKDLSELVGRSIELTRNGSLWAAMSSEAEQGSRIFGGATFAQQMLRIVGGSDKEYSTCPRGSTSC